MSQIDLVSACSNGGYHCEFAGGGLPLPNYTYQKFEELRQAQDLGTGITLNTLYANPYLWGFQYPIVCELRYVTQEWRGAVWHSSCSFVTTTETSLLTMAIVRVHRFVSLDIAAKRAPRLSPLPSALEFRPPKKRSRSATVRVPSVRVTASLHDPKPQLPVLKRCSTHVVSINRLLH